jgi:hypothetical protein
MSLMYVEARQGQMRYARAIADSPLALTAHELR